MMVGLRVRLTKQAARTMQVRAERSHYDIDWKARRGTVIRVGRFNNTTYVQWDGRRSLDHVPTKALIAVAHVNFSGSI